MTPAEILERDYTERDLLRRAVEHAGHDSCTTSPKWSHVASLFGTGSGVAMAICRKYGVNPDKMVGQQLTGECCPLCGSEIESEDD